MSLSSWLQFCNDACIMDNAHKGCTRADLAVSAKCSSMALSDMIIHEGICLNACMLSCLCARYVCVNVFGAAHHWHESLPSSLAHSHHRRVTCPCQVNDQDHPEPVHVFLFGACADYVCGCQRRN